MSSRVRFTLQHDSGESTVHRESSVRVQQGDTVRIEGHVPNQKYHGAWLVIDVELVVVDPSPGHGEDDIIQHVLCRPITGMGRNAEAADE